jgi:hypothetical protein
MRAGSQLMLAAKFVGKLVAGAGLGIVLSAPPK